MTSDAWEEILFGPVPPPQPPGIAACARFKRVTIEDNVASSNGWVELLGEVPVVPDEPRASMEAFARFKGGGPAWKSPMHELYVRRERELRRLKRRPGPDDHRSLVLWTGVGSAGCARPTVARS